MRLRVSAVLFTTAALAATATAQATPVTGDDLLERLTDPVAATAPLPTGARVIQRSSHEREGGNRDWGVWSGTRPQTYVRREQGGYVLLDETRPGCLSRMWFTAGVLGDMGDVGHLQLFFDGEQAPRVDVAPTDFFAGRVPGFPLPLVGDTKSSSGGFYSYIPFCFARGLKVRVTKVPASEQLWYQLTATVFPHGTPVTTYTPKGFVHLDEAASRFAHRDTTDGIAEPAQQRQLSPGTRFTVLQRDNGPASVRRLNLTVTPFLPDTLASLRLLITTDGATAPQIDVPLGALMGDGLSIRPIRSLAFGMDPVAGTGYLSLPIPYAHTIHAEVVANTSANVKAQAYLGEALPCGGTLHGHRFVQTPPKGLDYTVLAAPGSGRFAAWVLDLTGPPTSGAALLQFFLEGDERVRVDGSLSPSIYGTGTEDAFNSGFYYARGPLSTATHGAGLPLTNPDLTQTRSQYRVFGADGALWERGIYFGMEHGGGDEIVLETTASTAWWYERPRALTQTDSLQPSSGVSKRKHGLRGRYEARTLSAYFEGERDGNTADTSDPALGGTTYPAPDPSTSRESLTKTGISFTHPVSFVLRIKRRNCGVVVRRLLDQGTQTSVAVDVDGRRVGPWNTTEANPTKRWLQDDFELSARFTRNKSRIRVRLTPARGTTATLFSAAALTRRCS